MSDGAGPIGVGVLGVGKIARDQHIPVIAADPDLRLVATASPNSTYEGAPAYKSLDEMLAREPGVAAVAVCTPPQNRHALALQCLQAGKHVLLEKPPGAGLAEVDLLRRAAETHGVVLFASWHSRFSPAVEPARERLRDRAIRRVRIDWREDVHHWHPGQAWVWDAGGLGVFDPGINALSIATRILPQPFYLTGGDLWIPQGRQTPVTAELAFADDAGTEITAGFDWLETGAQTWAIRVDTDQGELVLSEGGAVLHDGGAPVDLPGAGDPHGEYAGVYRRFVELVREGCSEVDVSPLTHVADAYLRCTRREAAPISV